MKFTTLVSALLLSILAGSAITVHAGDVSEKPHAAGEFCTRIEGRVCYNEACNMKCYQKKCTTYDASGTPVLVEIKWDTAKDSCIQVDPPA